MRSRNAGWLARWEATAPPGAPRPAPSFRTMVREQRRGGRRGTMLPLVLLWNGHFVGQLTVNNIVGGSGQFASIGYWIDQGAAGHGIMPRAVALTIDHCFFERGLHRIEVAIRPENTNSLRVVEKLGLREVGYAPRFLHIDGDWRDHRIFAVTKEEVPHGMRRRLAERTAGDSPQV